MAIHYTSSSVPQAEKTVDVLDTLSSGIAKTAANEPKFEPKLWFQRSRPKLPASY